MQSSSPRSGIKSGLVSTTSTSSGSALQSIQQLAAQTMCLTEFHFLLVYPTSIFAVSRLTYAGMIYSNTNYHSHSLIYSQSFVYSHSHSHSLTLTHSLTH
jgi:hypothetical protein